MGFEFREKWYDHSSLFNLNCLEILAKLPLLRFVIYIVKKKKGFNRKLINNNIH